MGTWIMAPLRVALRFRFPRHKPSARPRFSEHHVVSALRIPIAQPDISGKEEVQAFRSRAWGYM